MPAEVIGHIFREYDAGHSARMIAAGLNADGIPTESGKGAGIWGASTIIGNWQRGTGILNNELYIGSLVWNRQKYNKNPQNQKRVGRLNQSAKLVTKPVPELQIIDIALWDRVKARQAAIRIEMNPAGVQNARMTALSSRRRCPVLRDRTHRPAPTHENRPWT